MMRASIRFAAQQKISVAFIVELQKSFVKLVHENNL